MRRLVSLAVSALALLLPVSAADASGDYGCEPSWKLASDALSACGSRALLSPGNDTRVNMFYLLFDRKPVAVGAASYPRDDYEDRSLGRSFFHWTLLRRAYDPAWQGRGEAGEFYGTRCNSVASGAKDFAAALAANARVPGAERAALTEARGLLVKQCNGEVPAAWPETVRSAPGREFLVYLKAAAAFYGQEWNVARAGFDKLRAAGDPWVAEAAAYMLGRTELNAAQAGSFDEYGDYTGPEKTDRAALARARAGLNSYLGRYARGRYAASARGLSRRALWLGGDVKGLAREYEALLGAVPPASRGAGDLVEEIDNKLIVANGGKDAVDSPLLLATVDLMLMRDAEESGVPVISAEALAAQKPRFGSENDLYRFVLANHAFYVAKDMRRVLQLIPDDARQPAYAPLAFSRQVLRGMALAALKDRNEAGFWRDLLGGATGLYQRPLVELALAMNYERGGKLADVFAPGSPIGDTAVRARLLFHIAGPDLLRAQAKASGRPQHERDLALFTLLAKQLMRGQYAGFGADLPLVRGDADSEAGLWDVLTQEKVPVGLFRAGTWSDGYACPALSATAAALARNPADFKGRLCLGDFYRINGFDSFVANDTPPAADELGGTPALFPGKAIPRAKFYADIAADARAPTNEKAYALYRAVMCYAPSGINECGGVEAPKSQRKAWHDRLKREFPGSEWAGKLRYYW